ncbi:aminotransferase [Vibrio natriegens NBRC 15636 = ATCC 14048 = DSM 759]|uniref:Aminotransferase n=1 Tax=Vibrio natriegens NBRC 15636 = ATCC 14048 = DSM 759 TaxID=1219067 RepID=A0AAN1CXB6_VIBNA|nr:aminotransferase [Vibrio natriegens NBRC 15636 = ATCC 14048 = DSM 759]
MSLTLSDQIQKKREGITLKNSTEFTALEAKDIDYVLHCHTNHNKHREVGPILIERGEGVFVYDNHGKKYLEGMSGMWCSGLGFSEKRLGEAAKKQYDILPFYHTFVHRSTGPTIELAAKLVEMAPVPMSKAFFTASGSEAIDSVVKLLWHRSNAMGETKRKKILARDRAYHGATIASNNLTGLDANHWGHDLIMPVVRLTCPHFYHQGKPGESEVEFATRLAEELEAKILEEGPETICCFIGEPIMGGGGVIVPPATYWEKIQAVLNKYDILFVADEVICGFGRTGNMFGTQTCGLKPDVLVYSKQLTSGYIPFAAFVMNERTLKPIYDASEKYGGMWHGFTTSGHPVACALSLENIRIIEEENLVENASLMGERLRAGFKKYLEHPLVGEVRGVGLLAAVELVTNKQTKTALEQVGQLGAMVAEKMREHGVITRPTDDAILLSPPMIINAEEIDMIIDALGTALDEVLGELESLEKK